MINFSVFDRREKAQIEKEKKGRTKKGAENFSKYDIFDKVVILILYHLIIII